MTITVKISTRTKNHSLTNTIADFGQTRSNQTRLFWVGLYCKTRRDIDLDKYKKVLNRVNAAIRKEKLEEEERICHVFKTNKKAFYGYVKSKQKVTSNNMRVRSVNGTITKSEVETAEELSTFFKSVTNTRVSPDWTTETTRSEPNSYQ